MLLRKLSVLENPLDTELHANVLYKLEDLILAAMIKYEYSSPCGNNSSWLISVIYGMVYLGPLECSANICKDCWGNVELHSQGEYCI